VDTRSDVSDCIDNESLDSDSDVPTTSSGKKLRSSTCPLTPRFPHPFFLPEINSDVAIQKRESLQHYEG